MSFELFLALRYLRGNRRTLGGGLTSAIAVGGIMVGVAALSVTLSIMTGFREDIRNKILGVQPHLLVMGSQGALPEGDWSPVFKDVPQVRSWSPYVMEQALIRKGSVTQGVVVKGVDPEGEPAVTGLNSRLIEGRWESLKEGTGGSLRPVFLGKELANTLHVGLGDNLLIAVPSSDMTPMMSIPAMYTFTVSGILETGLYDYDSSLAVIPLRDAQAIFQKPKEYSGLGVRIENPDKSVPVAMRLQKNVGSAAWVRSWLALNKPLFAALQLEKVMMFLVVALITLVAAFTIISNLILVTAQKVREIGILRAMGASRRSVQKIFLYKGLLMGGMGTVSGLVLGLILSLLLKRYQFIELPPDVYYVETLPVRIVPSDLMQVALAALFIVLLASIYPSRLAARLDTLNSIRSAE